MKLFRYFLTSLSAVLLLGTLSACSQPKKAASNRVTITFWHGMTGDHQQALNKMIQDFNHSQSTYQVVGSSQGNFGNVQQKITAAAKSHTLPTMAQTTYTNVPDYVHGNFIVPLNAYVDSTKLKQVVPSLRQSSQYQGKTYAWPFSKSARILFYNRDLLKKTGLSVPRTWGDLQRESAQAKAQGLNGLVLDQGFMAELNNLATQAGTPLMTPHPQLTSPKMIAATHVITDMLKQKTATTAGTDGFGNVKFSKGKTLFYSGSSAALGIMTASTPKGLHWGTAVLPSYHGRSATSISGNDLVLFKSASKAQRKGAAAFMQFWLTKRETVKWAKATGYLPLTKTALKSQDYRQYLAKNPTAKAAVKSLPIGFQDKAFYGYSTQLNAVNQTVSQLSTLEVTPEKGLAQLKAQLNREQK